MKDGFKDILGRRIAAVVVARNEKSHPHHQVFLVFDDGTRFEIYGEAFTCCGGVDRGSGIAKYIASAGGTIACVYGEAPDAETRPPERGTWSPSPPYSVEPPSDLENVLTREVSAWNAARAALARAMGRPGRPPR